MSIALACAMALALDLLLGEPRRWHPLVGFGHLAGRLEQRFNSAGRGWRSHGVTAWGVAVIPLTALCTLLSWLPVVGDAVAVGVLYLALGLRSLGEHVAPVAQALRGNDLPEARRTVSFLVSRHTEALDATGVAKAATESVLENGNDAVFAALFWFAVAGVPGVVLYRLSNTLDAMWGYRNERFERFGWAAARIDDVLNYVPARLVALTYALLGKTALALRCWQRQAPYWDSPNAGPVMAAGAGALGVELGGPAVYHGQGHDRAVLGEGPAADAASIEHGWQLVQRGVGLWVLILCAGAAFYA
ncbi:adenosylcobinamide-phosphate synthase CbiB [Pseudomonas typographi]|uniref:Cobalamin biosynthesis protein CobD n=1 Tax=Pseudomonas typographi TaxID=2715964 RepID=A0ABR7Z3Q6_9PSED|nr:adenosylcobinamide-phosphate synthase CbiB [Pseudomonas typographi]MBD1551957.1 cobalamin biosynthesis protein [Pseudomonas typographi]MBD1586521.1 cobalamin biosynthesis protein [Pseudomonas typographi]MBD1600022.1 cobalamin biosynthesis protein [Pseudomonas typographi]